MILHARIGRDYATNDETVVFHIDNWLGNKISVMLSSEDRIS